MNARQNELEDNGFWTLATIPVLTSGLFAFMCIHEFINVGILKNIGALPIGNAGPVPWYYETLETYIRHNFIYGCLFLFAFLFTIFSMVKRSYLGLILSILLTIGILTFHYS